MLWPNLSTTEKSFPVLEKTFCAYLKWMTYNFASLKTYIRTHSRSCHAFLKKG